MTKKEIEAFLLDKKGYLKKSPLNVARAIWRGSSKSLLPKTKDEVRKELELIKTVQKNLRLADAVVHTQQDIKLLDIYHSIVDEKNRPKRKLFFDIEVSPNIVFSWRIGSMISLAPDNIIQERAIICICYKWNDRDTVHSLERTKGNDKDILVNFSKIIDSADEIVTQNGDSFDVKWLRTRCLYHGIPVSPKFNSIDTLKMARAGFKFNSNKLDYMGKFLGVGQKNKTEYDLWRNIVLNGDKKAMNDMVEYCKQDVLLLEDVYNKLQPYCPIKKFKYKI